MLQQFTINIEETVAGEFKIMAIDMQDAYEIVRKKYYSGEFVLEPGEVHHKQMNIIDNKGNTAEWIQF